MKRLIVFLLLALPVLAADRVMPPVVMPPASHRPLVVMPPLGKEQPSPPQLRPTIKAAVGVHSHRCAWCGRVFTHEDSNFGNAEAHRCPYCGRDSGRPWPKIWEGTEMRDVPVRPQPARITRQAFCPT